MSIELVEVDRSGMREAVHRGSFVVLDADGGVALAAGAVDSPIWPRSTNKPWQAVTALAAGFEPISSEQLAISAASHTATPTHLALVEQILAGAGLTPDALRCPAALPGDAVNHAHVLLEGAPAPIYMECSGKHAAMLAACVAQGWPTDSYLEPEHPLQRAVVETFAQFSGDADPDLGIDGCGLPIVPLTLTQLAAAFAALMTAEPGSAPDRVGRAMRAHPFLISGEGADDFVLMTAVPGLVCKTGADGVFAAAFDDGGAFAVKFADGADRPRLPLAAAMIDAYLRRFRPGWATPALEETLADLAASPVLGGGARVGTLRAIPGVIAFT